MARKDHTEKVAFESRPKGSEGGNISCQSVFQEEGKADANGPENKSILDMSRNSKQGSMEQNEQKIEFLSMKLEE